MLILNKKLHGTHFATSHYYISDMLYRSLVTFDVRNTIDYQRKDVSRGGATLPLGGAVAPATQPKKKKKIPPTYRQILIGPPQ